MSGNRAMRRAVASKDAYRIGNDDLPAITDTTEFVDPDRARELLKRNSNNRPINWERVEEYKAKILADDFPLHSQGIILDTSNNILTGQTRLWAIIMAGQGVYLRISRGNSPDVARYLDRGRAQTSRDLASRETERKHSPSEVSIARGLCALRGALRPSADTLADVIRDNAASAALLLDKTRGIKKSKSVLMVMAAASAVTSDAVSLERVAQRIEWLSASLDARLRPATSDKCWNRGAAFGLAMEHARSVVAAMLAGGVE